MFACSNKSLPLFPILLVKYKETRVDSRPLHSTGGIHLWTQWRIEKERMERFPTSLPISQSFHTIKWLFCLWAVCTNMPYSANANCRPIIWTAHAVHVPSGPAANRWTVWQQSLGGAGRTDLKSVERQFLLIRLNHWRQMQPIQNSGNLWILRWALTYITMTSKHNFRGHIFRLFLLPPLFLSLLCPRLTRYCYCRCCWCWGFPPPLPPTPAAWKRHVCANKIN